MVTAQRKKDSGGWFSEVAVVRKKDVHEEEEGVSS